MQKVNNNFANNINLYFIHNKRQKTYQMFKMRKQLLLIVVCKYRGTEEIRRGMLTCSCLIKDSTCSVFLVVFLLQMFLAVKGLEGRQASSALSYASTTKSCCFSRSSMQFSIVLLKYKRPSPTKMSSRSIRLYIPVYTFQHCWCLS